MAATIGGPAPELSLPGTDCTDEGRRTYTLEEYRGQPVVVVFYPGDATPVCTRQLNAYADDIERFRDLDAQVLAISPQSVESHESFACGRDGRHGQGGHDDQGDQDGRGGRGFGFPLLADTDKAAGAAYGILGPLGFYRRSVFVVDSTGVLRWAHRAVAGLSFRSADELVEAIRTAG